MKRPRPIKYDWQRMVREELREERERKRVINHYEPKSDRETHKRLTRLRV